MASPKDIVLADALDVSGTGTVTPAVDNGPNRQYVELTLVATVPADNSIQAVVETGSYGNDWRLLDSTGVLSADGRQALSLTDADRYLRVRFVKTGDDTVTVSLKGVSNQLYCTPADITTFALPAASFANVPTREMVLGCLAATDEARSYLGEDFEGALTGWGTALRMHTANMAGYYVLKQRGLDVADDSIVRTAYEDALTWLARGAASDPTIVDETPAQGPRAVYAVSQPKRGWGQ